MLLRRVLCLCVFAIAALCGAQVKVGKPGLFSYTGPAGFARNDARVPKGHIGLFAKEVQGYSPNVMIGMGRTQFRNSAELGQSSLPEVKKDPDVEVFSSKTFKMAGADAFAIFSKRRLSTGLTIRQCQVIAVRKGDVLIFTASMLPSTAEKHQAAFLASLNSFKWLN